MNETSADVDRSTQIPLDSQGIKTNRAAHGIHDGIDRAHFVKFNVLRGDMVHFALRDRKFRENGGGDPLHVGIQAAIAIIFRMSDALRCW